MTKEGPISHVSSDTQRTLEQLIENSLKEGSNSQFCLSLRNFMHNSNAGSTSKLYVLCELLHEEMLQRQSMEYRS